MELLLHQWGDWPELYRNTDKTEATEIVIIDSQMNYRGKLDTYDRASRFAFSLKNYYTKDRKHRKEVHPMDTTCMAAGLFPHPPIMIPEIGGKELSRMALTVKTEEEAMKHMVEKGIDTVVIISPHNLCSMTVPPSFWPLPFPETSPPSDGRTCP